MKWARAVLVVLGIAAFSIVQTYWARTPTIEGALMHVIALGICMLPAWVVGRWIKQDERDAAQKAQRQRDREEENNLR